MTIGLLPQQIAPVSPEQAALTARFLTPAIPELMASFAHLRKQADIELLPRYPTANGKPYPLGRCDKIAHIVFGLLRQELNGRPSGGLAAFAAFISAGGMLRSIWGVLRNREFQNAFQLGGLYLDVANDTVDPCKPPIEILPMAESGMVSVADIAHFVRIAESYWGAAIYANHALPGLSPILPMISVLPEKPPRLQSACDYMIDLCRRNAFIDAEQWLASATPPPESVVIALRAQAPMQRLSEDPGIGKNAALAACRAARDQRRHDDLAWRNARVLEYLAIKH
jgi:hypothetical protein